MTPGRRVGGRAETGEPFTYLSLFSGIGGLDLGLDRAGMTCVGQVELDAFCRQVLAEHWPEVPRHDDVRTAVEWWGDRPGPDLVCGGFPCQPFSVAGSQRGTTDERWLWPAFADVLRALRPRYAIVENVADLTRDSVAWGWMLGDLHELGFDADWSVLSACAVGAPHTRQRVFLVAYPIGEFRTARLAQEQREHRPSQVWPGADGEHAWSSPEVWMEAAGRADRMADGPTHRMVAAGGNAVVPQVAEYVGRLILAADREVAA